MYSYSFDNILTEANKDWRVLERITEVASTGVELDEKTSSSHFLVSGSLTVLMGKHGFAEKLH
jgi:hypothetical protein